MVTKRLTRAPKNRAIPARSWSKTELIRGFRGHFGTDVLFA
jgi:hypothetical protein